MKGPRYRRRNIGYGTGVLAAGAVKNRSDLQKALLLDLNHTFF